MAMLEVRGALLWVIFAVMVVASVVLRAVHANFANTADFPAEPQPVLLKRYGKTSLIPVCPASAAKKLRWIGQCSLKIFKLFPEVDVPASWIPHHGPKLTRL